MTTLVIDESGDDITGRHRYVIGAGVIVTDLAEVRAEVAAHLARRRRPFHWVAEGSVTRHAMLDLIGRLGIDAYAVVSAADSPQHLEFVRDRCLRELFRVTQPSEPDAVIIESREKSTAIIGQNRLDFTTMIEARHAGELAPTVHYEWAGKSEQLVWLADAVAGAVLAAERGDVSWVDRLSLLTRVQVVRIPPERA
jgi:hypothetical protein